MWRVPLLVVAMNLAAPGGAAGGKNGKETKPKVTDPKTWTPIRISGQQRAPEFEDIAEWLNSEPLTVKGLQGKVVVIHFMAFG